MICLIKRQQVMLGLTAVAVSFLSSCKPETNVVSKCLITESEVGEFIELPPGEFKQSLAPIYPEEYPTRTKTVASFKLLKHEVTNAEFARFVEETAYITDAERALKSQRADAGSALFSMGANDGEGTWELVNGATWRHPEGPGSSIDDKARHPVVHVSHNDATSYAKWAGGRLPSEVEWEYAASLGIRDKANQFSGAFDENGDPVANTWQGLFPIVDSGDDGFKGSSPVGCFPANEIGVYDMIGNVWEWTDTSYGERNHTIKGGSFLCAENFCKRFRPAARQPHESDFSTNHIGFRIAKDLLRGTE